MSSSTIITLEFLGVIGLVLGLGVWELVRLKRERARDVAAEAPARDPGENTDDRAPLNPALSPGARGSKASPADGGGI